MIQTLALLVFAITCGQVPAEFEVRLLGDKPHSGAVNTLDSDGTLNIGGEKIKGSDWYSLRRSAGVLPDWSRQPHVELVNGDRIRGSIVSADGDAIRLLLPLAGPAQIIRIPFSALRAAWLTRRPEDDPAWLNSPRKRDFIQSRNGDLTLGAIAVIDGERKVIRVAIEGKEQELPLNRVAAIGFNTDLARVRKPKGPYFRLTFAGGTRLSAASVSFDGTVWTITTQFKDTIRLASNNLLAIDVEQGRAIWLSDLKPTAYEYKTFDGEQFSWTADRCVSGEALRLKTPSGESTFDRGIGLHAECAITYSLAGKFKRFETLVGLDAKSGTRGDAVISMFLDGKEQELDRKGRLTIAGGPVAINLDVTGAKELKIVIKRANAGNVQDHVNLAEARLIP